MKNQIAKYTTLINQKSNLWGIGVIQQSFSLQNSDVLKLPQWALAIFIIIFLTHFILIMKRSKHEIDRDALLPFKDNEGEQR